MQQADRVPPIFSDMSPEGLKGALAYLEKNAPDGGGNLRRQATAFERAIDPNRNREESSLTGFLEGAMAKKTIRRIQARFEDALYFSGPMLVRPESMLAYRVLMSAVYHLNKPDEIIQPDLGDSTTREAAHSQLEKAMHRFCSLLNPCCYTVYYWGRRTNKSTLLVHHGLRYPEAMQGFTWTHDVSRAILFDDESRPVLPEVGETPGTFRVREGIMKASWAIHLRTDRMRLVLFLNWRDENTPRFIDPVTGTALPLNNTDVMPAVRYFAGWLATSGLGPTETLPGGLPTPAVIVEDAWNAANSNGPQGAVKLLKSAVRNAIGVTDCHVAIHAVVPGSENAGKGDPVLQFDDGDYEGQPSRTPTFSITPDERGLVPKSISAQSAAWRTPILIENMDATIEREGIPHDLWRTLDVTRRMKKRTYTTKSQLAVPIKSGGALSAVINVESPGGDRRRELTREHLRRTELVANLYASFRALKTKDTDTPSFVEEICQTPHPKNTDDLLRRFTRFVRGETNGDLVYVLLYDHLARVLRPNGISACSTLVAKILSASHGDYPCSIAEEEPHPLCLEFLARYLIPRRRGRSWKCLVTAKPDVIWNAMTEKPPPSRFTQEHFVTALALPFPCPVSGRLISPQPNGVIWVRWKEHPTHLASDGQALVDKVGRLIAPISQAVSAVYEIYLHTEEPWHTEST